MPARPMHFYQPLKAINRSKKELKTTKWGKEGYLILLGL